MSDTWVIVKWPERVFGQSESGFDSSSPRTGIVVWEPDKTREKVTLSSGLRKCFPYSLEHFRYAQAEGFIKALLGELDYILLYWLISREFAKSLDLEVPQKSVKSGAKYNVTKDFHSVLEGLGVDPAHFPDSKKIIGTLERLKAGGNLLDDHHVKGAFRYIGVKTLEDMWGANPKFIDGNHTKEYLNGALSVLFHGNSDKLSQLDFSQVLKAVNEQNCPAIIKYSAEIWCGHGSDGLVEKFIRDEPLKFIRDFIILIAAISDKAPKHDSFKLRIASELTLPLIDHVIREPIIAAFTIPEVARLDAELSELKMEKFSVKSRSQLTSITKDQAQGIIESLIAQTDSKYWINTEPVFNTADVLETLTAISSVIRSTGHEPVLSNMTGDQVIALYKEFEDKESEILRVGGTVLALRKSFEYALTAKIAKATDADVDLLEKIRSTFEPKGCIPGTFPNEVFHALCERNPKESSRPGWWMPLSLSQIVSNCREHSHLTKDVASLWVKSKHFSNELSRHVRDSRNTSDLAVLLEADHLFDIISSSDISQAWSRVASRSAFLEAVTDDIADSRVADLRNSMSKEHEKALAKNRDRELELEAKVKELMENISSMDSAMQRGAETLGAAKLGHELGVSKKFCEALAKMIRRMEREFGATAFKEILNKESAGLSRLGVTLMVASENTQFDPASHDPAGRTINLGSNVKILETGVLLSVGKDTITILKAVVNPAD
jgi:hypothetical protein